MTSRPREGIVRKWVLCVALTVVPLLGVGLGAVAAAIAAGAAGDAEPRVEWSPVETGVLVGGQDVDVALTWSEPAVVRNPGWSGLVTAVHVAVGDTVTTGTPVLDVHGVRRLAYSAPSPLFETVGADSPTASIAAVSTFLATLGYAGPRTSWDWRLEDAVQRFARDIGLPDAASAQMFDPSWVVWIPAAEVRVGSGVPRVGDTATDEVFTLPATLAAVEASADQVVPDAAASPWQLRIGDATVPFEGFPLTAPDALAQLASEIGPGSPETSTARLSPVDAPSGWTVASASVLIGDDGGRCVVAAEPDAVVADDLGGFAAVPVEVVPGSPPGVAWVTAPALPDAAVVLSTPTAVDGRFRCT